MLAQKGLLANISGLVSFATQFFYAHRLYLLSVGLSDKGWMVWVLIFSICAVSIYRLRGLTRHGLYLLTRIRVAVGGATRRGNHFHCAGIDRGSMVHLRYSLQDKRIGKLYFFLINGPQMTGILQTIMWLVGTAACDIVIAASMVYYLVGFSYPPWCKGNDIPF